MDHEINYWSKNRNIRLKGKMVISLMSVVKINSTLPCVTLRPNMTYLNLINYLRIISLILWGVN